MMMMCFERIIQGRRVWIPTLFWRLNERIPTSVYINDRVIHATGVQGSYVLRMEHIGTSTETQTVSILVIFFEIAKEYTNTNGGGTVFTTHIEQRQECIGRSDSSSNRRRSSKVVESQPQELKIVHSVGRNGFRQYRLT